MSFTHHVEYSKEGAPLYSVLEGGASIITTDLGAKPTKTKPNREESTTAAKWVPWGNNDTFPQDVVRLVSDVNTGKSTLHLLTKMLHGRNVIPCRIVDYDENGKEVVEYYKPKNLPDFYTLVQSSNFNRWRLAVAQDYAYFSNAFPELILNKERSKIVALGHNKAAHCRYSPFNEEKRRIEHVFVSGNFPNPLPIELANPIPLIDPSNMALEVDRVRNEKAYKYIFGTNWPDVINNYYTTAYWDSARKNGWMEIARSIPKYKMALFKNSMTIKYHIQIPYSYWSKKYKDWEQQSAADRSAKVAELHTHMNEYLTGAENAMKTFISYFSTGHEGKDLGDGWKIEVLDDKVKSDAYLPDGAAANQEILYSFLFNPAQIGAAAAAGSLGGANSGGSNIREAHLVTTSLLQADRDIIYGILEFVKLYNGWPQDLIFRVQDQVLTTLDKGRGTEKLIS